eukprot:tig00000704_g3338.t1
MPPQRWYTNEEVRQHNTPQDCWVSFLGRVFNLSTLIAANPGILAEPILRYRGEDISHWFDPKTQDVRTHIHPVTNLPAYYAPEGRFIHLPPDDPAEFVNDFGTPWWKDEEKYMVGYLSKHVRKIRVVNMLTQVEHLVEVPAEETLEEILDRYLPYNAHAGSYTWKKLDPGSGSFVNLNMKVALQENGVFDESDEYLELNLDTSFYVPVLHLYFNDDLSVA